MTLWEFAFQPFADYGFMRRALAACAALALSGAPLGVFLVLRRMALMGDAMSHAILPGVAVGFLLFGLALLPMALGGMIAGLLVVALAGIITRLTPLKEDASLTGITLVSLAAGVLMVSLHGSSVDLMHVLFGNVLAVDNGSLTLVMGIATVSTLMLALFYRHLVIECFDPGFMRSAGRAAGAAQQLFMMLAVLNLVAAFQALGTLMALGLMLLPAIAARFWSQTMEGTLGAAVLIAFASGYIGLLLSYHASLPSGPAIVLTAGAGCGLSLLLGRHGGLAARLLPHRHFAR